MKSAVDRVLSVVDIVAADNKVNWSEKFDATYDIIEVCKEPTLDKAKCSVIGRTPLFLSVMFADNNGGSSVTVDIVFCEVFKRSDIFTVGGLLTAVIGGTASNIGCCETDESEDSNESVGKDSCGEFKGCGKFVFEKLVREESAEILLIFNVIVTDGNVEESQSIGTASFEILKNCNKLTFDGLIDNTAVAASLFIGTFILTDDVEDDE